jgi:hypothetical protein
LQIPTACIAKRVTPFKEPSKKLLRSSEDKPGRRAYLSILGIKIVLVLPLDAWHITINTLAASIKDVDLPHPLAPVMVMVLPARINNLQHEA